MTTAPPPSRKPILLGVVGVSALLIGISALLPSASERRTEEKRRRLSTLTKVAVPPVSTTPAIATSWSSGYSGQRGRDVTSHFYHRLGAKSRRTDLMHALFSSEGRARTVVHLRFDPADPDQVRLATAFALAVRGSDPSGALALNVLEGKGLDRATVRQRVAGVEKNAGVARLAETRRALLAELRQSSVGAYPPETSLLEVDGRFYREASAKGTVPLTPGVLPAQRHELVEALSDPLVVLP